MTGSRPLSRYLRRRLQEKGRKPMLGKRRGRKALCLLMAVCLIATGFSAAGPVESHAADNPQAQHLVIDAAGVNVKCSYGDDNTYNEELYTKLISNDYNAAYNSEGSALEIKDAADLAAFAKAVNQSGKTFEGKYVKLMNSIDLEGTPPKVETVEETENGDRLNITISNPDDQTGGLENVWKPIGKATHPFKGTFEGGGYTISRMVVCEKDLSNPFDGGLFGNTVNATIRNLGVEDAFVVITSDTTATAGGLVGVTNGVSITNCHAGGEIYASAATTLYVGGLTGETVYTAATSIKSCHANVNVHASAARPFVGGLVGENTSGSSITDCSGKGNVHASASGKRAIAYVGGLAGYTNSSITGCYGTGDAYASASVFSNDSTTSAFAGGLAGGNGPNADITGCYSTGDAYAYAFRNSNFATDYATAYAGGLAGTNNSTITNCYSTGDAYASVSGTGRAYAGGLAGENKLNAGITCCYSTGDAYASVSETGTAYAGGLAGENSGSITNCYRNSEAKVTSTQNSEWGNINREGAPLNLQQMTGTGTGRADKMMTALGDGWTFKADEKIDGGDHRFNCYFPRLKSMDNNQADFSHEIYTITVTPGKKMTLAADSGAETQSVFASDGSTIYMEPIIYKADNGVTFPEDYVSRCTIQPGGKVTVKRNSDSQITISGMLTADTAVTLADAGSTPGSYYCTLTADAISFPDLQAGDTPQPQPLRIHCSGNTGATITRVALSSADFLLDDSRAESYVGAGKTNSTYLITPKAGLAPGSYKAKVTVTYSYGRTAEADITLTVTKAKQAAPAKLTAKSKNYRTVALSWKKADRAEKYQVYRAAKKKGTYKRISTTSKNSLNNIRLTTGKTYYYKVRAYRTVNGKKVYSPFTNIASAEPKPFAPSFSLKAGRGRITASWKGVSGATGYRIYRASAKNGKFTVIKDSRGKARSYTSAKLRSRKTYYYKMRAYRVVDGKKIYSNYTRVKAIRTK